MIRVLIILSTLATACVVDDPFTVNPRDPSAGGPKTIAPGIHDRHGQSPDANKPAPLLCHADLACEFVSCVSNGQYTLLCFCLDDNDPLPCQLDPEEP